MNRENIVNFVNFKTREPKEVIRSIPADLANKMVIGELMAHLTGINMISIYLNETGRVAEAAVLHAMALETQSIARRLGHKDAHKAN